MTITKINIIQQQAAGRARIVHFDPSRLLDDALLIHEVWGSWWSGVCN